MNRRLAQNCLLVLGAGSVAEIFALLFSVVIPFGALTFRGDFGIVLLWVWLGVPQLLAAIVAATMLLWVTDTRRPLSWLSGLAALFFYSESMHAWGQFRRGWHEPPRTPDYIGIAIATVIPALACLAIGIWWSKRVAGKAILDSSD